MGWWAGRDSEGLEGLGGLEGLAKILLFKYCGVARIVKVADSESDKPRRAHIRGGMRWDI